MLKVLSVAAVMFAFANIAYAGFRMAPMPQPVDDVTIDIPPPPKPGPPKEKTQKETYVAYIPTTVRPGFPVSLSVSILEQQRNPVEVHAVLNSTDLQVNFQAMAVIRPGQSRVINFEERIPLTYDGSRIMNMTIWGIDVRTNKEIFRNLTTRIRFESKSFSVFIQTDKGIYQPGQTIKFRTIVVTPELLPFDGTITYRVLDPNNNVVLLERDASLTSGVVSDQYQLPQRASGWYSIKIKVHNYEETLRVNVYEYKLPKFSVSVDPDSFVHPKSEGLGGSFKGTYTFGEPVQGNAVVEVYRMGYCGEKIAITKEYPVFDGDESFFFPIKQLKDVFGYNYDDRYVSEKTVTVSASVTDGNTGETFTETKSVDLKNTHIKIEKLSPPSTIKPGLLYEAYVKVTLQDGTLLSDEERNSMELETRISFNLPYNGRRWPSPIKQTQFSSIPSDGIVRIQVTAPNNNFTSARFEPQIKGIPTDWRAQWTASRFKSPSDSFIQVRALDSNLAPGSRAIVYVSSNIELGEYKLDVLSRGSLVESVLLSETSYQFDVTYEMQPSLQVVVSFVNPENQEIVADSLKINVKSALQNQVSIELSEDEVDVRESVDITVNAHPGSYVGLVAVDQSVLLLDEGNDVTEDRIFRDLNQYNPNSYGGFDWGRYWWPTPSSGSDATEVFHRSGFEVLTNAFLYSQRWVPKRQPGQPGQPGFSQNRGAGEAMAFEADMAMAAPAQPGQAARIIGGSQPVQQTQVRSEFPENWIWTESSTKSNGKATLTYTVPDTITTWELSSFAVSDEVGLGVTKENAKLKVFRNFFVQLDLAPTITRGEILIMRASVFNYFEDDIVANVELSSNEWIELQEPDGTSKYGYKRVVTIPSKGSVKVVFPIKFLKVGRAPIMVSAATNMAGDALKRTITVKPEGIMKTVTESKLIDKESNNQGSTTSVSFSINTPDDVIEGSEYVNLYAYGDILGSTLGNLGNLLQMPGGCGEQNLLSFAPDVFITLYLQNANKLDDNTKAKAYSHIRNGYSNQLTYKRYDGSYSAFGSRDNSGSTWLTSFVVKCFLHARNVNQDFIEDSVVAQALKFIMKQQEKDGVFAEPGRVIHTSMQGGVNSKVTMTAYVLISLLENDFLYNTKNKEDTFNEDLMTARINAQEYLERESISLSDKYALAIVTYALTLAKSSMANDLFIRLDSMATIENGNMYWTDQQRCFGVNCFTSRSSDIEMTAYALLTYATYGKVKLADAFPIVRWLVTQRNSFGGYYSTQDTVIAIQALSEIAKLMSNRNQALSITKGGTDMELFSITDENDIVLQSTEITDLDNDVEVDVYGEGFGILQLTTNYNVRTEETSDEPFKITATIKEINAKTYDLNVCTRINTDRQNPLTEVGMFLVTVNLANGFTVDIDDAKFKNPKAKLIEMTGTTVNLYYDTVTENDECFTLKLERFIEIANMKKQVITALDYYKPDLASYREYVIESLAIAEVCDVCGSECPGCPAPAWDDWMPWEKYCGKNSRERLCKDSNGEMSTKCKGEYKRYAYETPFSCPSLSDGLYIDPRSALYEEAQTSGEARICKAPRGSLGSQQMDGLPATYLNGNDQLIVCDDSIFKKMLSRDDGFTIAFLLLPRLARQKRYTILSIGSDTMSHVSLIKPPRSNVLKLTIKFRDYEYTVSRIPFDNNAWQHIAIVWNPDGGAKVLMNGAVVGSSSKTSGKDFVSTTSRLICNLIFGISHEDQRDTEIDYVRGLYTSLDIWNRDLSEGEVQMHYQYYSAFIGVADPYLSLAQVRHIAPKSIAGCFDKSIQASELKARIGEVINWCG